MGKGIRKKSVRRKGSRKSSRKMVSKKLKRVFKNKSKTKRIRSSTIKKGKKKMKRKRMTRKRMTRKRMTRKRMTRKRMTGGTSSATGEPLDEGMQLAAGQRTLRQLSRDSPFVPGPGDAAFALTQPFARAEMYKAEAVSLPDDPSLPQPLNERPDRRGPGGQRIFFQV